MINQLNSIGKNTENLYANNFSPIKSRIQPRITSGLNEFQGLNSLDEEMNSPFIVKKSSHTGSSGYGRGYTDTNLSQMQKIYTPSPMTGKERFSDRFIPMNKGTNLMEKFELTKKWSNDIGRGQLNGEKEECDTGANSNNGNQSSNTQNSYSYLLESNFFGENQSAYPSSNTMSQSSNNSIKSKLFSFKSEKKKKKSGILTSSSQAISGQSTTSPDTNINYNRKINNRPYKVLDAPGLLDDFYLNLVDWSSTNDLAVGLNNTVYLWCANKTQVVKLLNYEGDKYVSSVIWNPNGTEVAVGNSDGIVEIWDVGKKKISRILEGHSARVGVVAWNNQQTLSTGSKDYSILNRDLRQSANSYSKYLGHKQEVCGLKWSFDGTQLASGGNDNKLMVWNMHSNTPLMKSSHHSAAVKAIAWSPHQNNLLASGGGTADRCIRFWNTSTYSQVSYVDTGSQVCNLVFSKTVNELVSTHGYSLNQIITWKLPSMTKLATLTGHTYRVLYLSISPDGQNIVTGAGDETLRFWNIFPPMKSHNEGSSLFPSNTDLR